MFRSHLPVTAEHFYDRREELTRLEALVSDLVERSEPRWLAILGQRKMGKSSLVRELERRTRQSGLSFVVLDLFDRAPVTVEVFRTYAWRVLDSLVGTEIGLSVERLVGRPEYASRVLAAPRLASLPAETRDLLAQLPTMELDAAGIIECLDLPERLAGHLGVHFVSAWDEFQELASLRRSRHGPDVLAVMRSAWQRHERVAYVVSGSAPTMLKEMVAADSSPFFLHFDVMELGPMADDDAIELLRDASEGAFEDATTRRLYAVFGGHPFYLQVAGEEVLRRGPPYDTSSIKEVLSQLVFSSSGRLALYFQRRRASLVGRSSYAAAVLAHLSEAPREGWRLVDVANAVGAPAGDTTRYIQRLGDAIVRSPEGRYVLTDPVFGAWLRWAEPGGAAVPMAVLGNEGERIVAERLAQMGFDLVYQSRASRGAFDLLATRGANQLGVQVKRSPLPLAFSTDEWNRMEAEGQRLGWRYLIAAVDPKRGVVFLDPAGARRKRTVRLHAEAAVDNVLSWLDSI